MFAKRSVNERIAWERYDAGESDEQIADACGCCKETVRKWRNLNNLPRNIVERRSKKSLSPLVLDCIAAREAGMTYGQYKAQQYLEQQKGVLMR